MLTCQLRPSQRWSRFQKQVKVNMVPIGHFLVGKSANQRSTSVSCPVGDLLVFSQSSTDQTIAASAGRINRRTFPRETRWRECRRLQISYWLFTGLTT